MELNAEYGACHRYFMRSMLSWGVMPLLHAKQILGDYLDSPVNDIKEFIAVINKEISPLQQRLKIVMNEHSATEEVVFIWTADDDVSRSQGRYSKSELEYFKCILEEVITSDSKSISETTALNLVSKVVSQSLSKVQAQKLLDHWCSTYYLMKGSSEEYFLGTKGIHEFEHYFKTHYADFTNSCNICKNFVFWVKVCTNCSAHFHVHCLKRYFDNVSTAKCPNCKNEWIDSSDF